ncbi:uncharacterized protein CDAR_185711 [Caerostris darwini]|uniref:Uncharacterized protein n=1 Tax=Caerostris darwini TaxID=1538125 RepID=A0AAV4T8F8_9ARAC|nr:uncharacterized protein CDAR_185711 [Caerostris darwini]
MLRHRLVRQSAMNISSSSEASMPSPQPIRRRRNSQDSRMYRQLSSDSLDNLLGSSEGPHQDRKNGARRHSVACGVLYVDIQKPSLKSAFNSAVKRMSSACSVLSSAPSSTYNLSGPHQSAPPSKKKEEEILLPHVLGTFHHNMMMPQSQSSDKKTVRNSFQVNRRFSTDCPPPSYMEATNLWKQPASRQRLTRQQQVVISKESLVAVEDDDFGNLVE